MEYTEEELTDMLLVYGFCQGNGRRSVRVYRDRFPNRRIPNRTIFANIERRLRETCTFTARIHNSSRQQTARNVEQEEAILEMIDEEPEISTRAIERTIAVPKTTVNRVIREQLLHPFHSQRVQDLLPIDPDTRLRFCQTFSNRLTADRMFYKRILFTDESCFTRRGITNCHNYHIYADRNPHTLRPRHFQTEFKINVWMGIIDSHLIGPYRMPEKLNGRNYLHFLENILPELLENVPLALRQEMIFMHDGAPPHFALPERQFLNTAYPERWFGRGADAPMSWLPRSPDLNPCNFFLWGALKTKVYETRINSIDELWNRIVNAANLLREQNAMQRVIFNFSRRVEICQDQYGRHIEHLLQ